MPRCPVGHASATAQWCAVCGRPLGAPPATCRVCAATLACRFCDECGADDAVPVATARIAPDPEWFAHATGHAVPVDPPDTPAWRVRLEHRRTVLGRRRPGTPVPDVDLGADAGVSARHAVLIADDDGGWTVVDLGSRNGTAVGTYEPVVAHRPTPVPAGTVVRLGLWTSVLIEPA